MKVVVTPQQQAPKRRIAVPQVFGMRKEQHDDVSIHYETPTKGPRGVGLSPCAMNYAKALANPFGEFSELPCVPGEPPVPTYRYKAMSRGTFTTGTLGYGFVAYAPQCAPNDVTTVFTTTINFAGNAIDVSGVGIGAAYRSTLPFTAGQLATGIGRRLVGSAIRVRNISQALNVGGILYGTQIDVNEDHSTFNAATIPADPRTAIVGQSLNQEDWSVMVWRPVDMGDLDFQGEDTAIVGSQPRVFFFAVAPSPATSQTYEYELVEFWEFNGKGVPEYTVSHSDPVGLSRVLDGIQMRPITLSQKDWINHTASSVVDSIAHSDSVAKTVEDLLGLAGLNGGVVGGLVKGLTAFLAL